MKKSLLTLLLLLTSVLAHAFAAAYSRPDVFTAPERGTYSDGYVVNVQLNVNGTPINANGFANVELAAFVGGDCRDVISINQNTERFNRNNNFFMVRAMGSENENGKAVTFKAVVDGVAYKFTTQLAYAHGESYTVVPLVLYLDKITGIELPQEITIEQKIGSTYDLNKHITYLYQDKNGGLMTPKGQSSLDTDVTPIVGDWDFGNSASFFTVDSKNILTVKAETRGAYLGCTLLVGEPKEQNVLGSAYTNIVIKEPAIPVTGINLAKNSIDTWVGESVWDYVDEQFVTILPANASNKNFNIAPTSVTLRAGGINEKLQIEKRGTWTVDVYSLDNTDIKKTLTVNAKQHVMSIASSERQLTVNKGDDVFAKVKELITVSPADADNKTLNCRVERGNSPAGIVGSDGIAKAVGSCTVTVESDDNPNAVVSVLVVVLQPVTSITAPASIECWKGDNFYNIIGNDITINPSDATDTELTLSQIEGPQAGMNAKGTFEKAGTYKVRLTANSNAQATADITVIVKQHVEGVTVSQRSIEANVGDNVYEAIRKMVSVLPADAYNKNVSLRASSDIISNTGVALASGQCTVAVISDENPQYSTEVSVTIINPVKSITATPAEITVTVGTNVLDYISKNVSISIAPAETDQSAYVVAVSSLDANNFPNNVASKAGNYTWDVISTANRAISTAITVHVVENVAMSCPQNIDLTLNNTVDVNLSLTAGKELYDYTLVVVEFEKDIVKPSFITQNGLFFTLTGTKLGNTTYTVKYDGKEMCSGTINVGAEIALASGWNWISNYTKQSIALCNATDASYMSEYFQGDSKIFEMRSQTGLLFNDDTYGVFGQITDIEAATMYKVNAAGEKKFVVYSTPADAPTISDKGYTWIAYPVIGDHSFAYINDKGLLSSATEGDAIIGKTGFAEYDGRQWNASSDFMLETGKGYIYYQENAATKKLNFGSNYVEEKTTRREKAYRSDKDVWQFDTNAFADNMCIVAKIDGIDADDKYSVGAFVGEECRGMGTFVNDEVMFINVAGKSGDVVSFKLYNSETGMFSDIKESVKYAAKKGSLKAPLCITSTETTAIAGISADASEDVPAYNVSGQRVNASARGIVIKGGKKYFNK